VSSRAWPAITVATAIATPGYWFASFALSGNVTVTMLVIAIISVLALFALVGISGAADPLSTATRSATYGIAVGAVLMLLFGVTGNGAVAVVVPIAILGVGGSAGLAPVGDPQRLAARSTGVALAALVVVGGMFFAPDAAALLAPVLALPAVGLADRAVDARSAAAEGV